MHNEKFWLGLEKLVKESEIFIDRPKGSAHPRFTSIIYQLDYGYLKGTYAGDGDGIDVWIGSDKERTIDAVMCTVDLNKRDSELKILLGCTEKEKEIIYDFHNQLDEIAGILIRREKSGT